MTDLDAWLDKNAIVCERYRQRLSPHACLACQRATPERCEGCERTKEQPQLTPRQAQHLRGSLNGAKTRRSRKMREKEVVEEATTPALAGTPSLIKEGDGSKGRRVAVNGEWRGGLRDTLREIAGEAVLSEADPRIVRLVKCCHFLAEQVAVRDEAGAAAVFGRASVILGR